MILCLINDPDQTTLTLAQDEAAAKATVESYPDIDAVERCFTDPGNDCLCSQGGAHHEDDPAPVPGYQVWVIHRVVGGPLWCARRRDQTAAVLNADDPDDLAVLIADQAGDARNQG